MSAIFTLELLTGKHWLIAGKIIRGERRCCDKVLRLLWEKSAVNGGIWSDWNGEGLKSVDELLTNFFFFFFFFFKIFESSLIRLSIIKYWMIRLEMQGGGKRRGSRSENVLKLLWKKVRSMGGIWSGWNAEGLRQRTGFQVNSTLHDIGQKIICAEKCSGHFNQHSELGVVGGRR